LEGVAERVGIRSDRQYEYVFSRLGADAFHCHPNVGFLVGRPRLHDHEYGCIGARSSQLQGVRIIRPLCLMVWHEWLTDVFAGLETQARG